MGQYPSPKVYHAGYMGQAGAFATHYRYPAGSQTYAQLTAERNNLIKARAAKGYYHKTSAAKSMARNHESATFRGNLARNHVYGEYYLASIKQHAVGVRWMAFHQKAKIKKGLAFWLLASGILFFGFLACGFCILNFWQLAFDFGLLAFGV